MDSLRQKQAANKQSKQKYQDQMKQLNDSIQKKLGEFKSSRDKLPYKTIGEVDAQIASLEKSVESGSLKLIDEKRAVNDISSLKKARKTLEGFQGSQGTIDAERKQYEDLKKHLDDPESRQLSNQYNTIKAELDAIKEEQDAHYQSRDKLYKERDEYQKALDEAWTRKKELLSEQKAQKDAYWNKIREEREKRNEKNRLQRAEWEEGKVKDIAAKKREDASHPAFEQEILICNNLVQYFNPGSTKASWSAAINPSTTAAITNIRKPDDSANVPSGSFQLKKKDEEEYFVGSGGKKNKKKSSGTSTPSKAGFNIPLSVMEDLMTLSITVPLSQAEVPDTIEKLNEKREWFKENQERQTKENQEKVEKEIKDMEAKAAEKKAKILSGEDREERGDRGAGRGKPRNGKSHEDKTEKSS